MKKLLIITGDLATGKSTFAGLLSKHYETSAFCKDSIKEVLGDAVGFANREENKKLSCATVALMCHIFEQTAILGKNLILEANFHTNELEKLHQIAKENGYDVLTVILRGDVEVLHQRYLNRMRNENRHPVHLSTTFDVFEDFCEYIENSRNEAILGEVLIINANDFEYQTDKAIWDCLDAFYCE